MEAKDACRIMGSVCTESLLCGAATITTRMVAMTDDDAGDGDDDDDDDDDDGDVM